MGRPWLAGRASGSERAGQQAGGRRHGLGCHAGPHAGPVQQIQQVLGGDVARGGGGERAAADTSRARVQRRGAALDRGDRIGVARVTGVMEMPAQRKASRDGGRDFGERPDPGRRPDADYQAGKGGGTWAADCRRPGGRTGPGRRYLRGASPVNSPENAPHKPRCRAGTPGAARKVTQESQQHQGHLLIGSGHSARGGGSERCRGGAGRSGAADRGAGAGRSWAAAQPGSAVIRVYRAGAGWDRRLRRNLKTRGCSICGRPDDAGPLQVGNIAYPQPFPGLVRIGKVTGAGSDAGPPGPSGPSGPSRATRAIRAIRAIPAIRASAGPALARAN